METRHKHIAVTFLEPIRRGSSSLDRDTSDSDTFVIDPIPSNLSTSQSERSGDYYASVKGVGGTASRSQEGFEICDAGNKEYQKESYCDEIPVPPLIKEVSHTTEMTKMKTTPCVPHKSLCEIYSSSPSVEHNTKVQDEEAQSGTEATAPCNDTVKMEVYTPSIVLPGVRFRDAATRIMTTTPETMEEQGRILELSPRHKLMKKMRSPSVRSSLTRLSSDISHRSDEQRSARSSPSTSWRNTLRALASHRRSLVGENKELSEDTFSFMIFAPVRSFSFLLSLLVFGTQITTFTLLLLDIIDVNQVDNPVGIPVNVGIETRLCQFIAIIIAAMTQEDLRSSFVLIHEGYQEEHMGRAFQGSNHSKWVFSISCRLIESSVGLIATFFLIITESSVFELLLNFTAIEFVSHLDDVTFSMVAAGFFGVRAQGTSKIVADTKYTVHKQQNTFFLTLVSKTNLMIFILVTMLTGWAVVVHYQVTGKFMANSFFVQFGDDFIPGLGSFSGPYDRNILDYIERLPGGRQGSAKFSYCQKLQAWAFSIGQDKDSPSDSRPCEDTWLAKSSETTSMDITETLDRDWYVRGSAGQGKLQHLVLIGLDCEREDDVCGDKGTCMGNECVCESGWYGLQCNFPEPCRQIATDIRYESFRGATEWSSHYSLLPSVSVHSHPVYMNEKKDGEFVSVHSHPVYVNEKKDGEFDIILFTGRRWILTHLSFPDGASSLQAYLERDFHAYWSDYPIAFITEAMDVYTPIDAVSPERLKWYHTETTNDRLQRLYPNFRKETDVQLLCTMCDNDTNPCFYNGVCMNETHTCDCPPGSDGILCQVPPVKNGNCDPYFNTPEFGYDGGDCCEVTCVTTQDFTCGEGVLQSMEDGSLAFGPVGYPHCTDPEFSNVLSGSLTLYNIVKSGRLKCGMGLSMGFWERVDGGDVGFEVDLCRAIAAAVLSDPEAIEIVETTSATRFIDLHDEKFHVLIRRTTFTAERDISEKNTNEGFSFMSTPYFYDGLKYGGIPPFVACADNLDWESPQCIGLKVCVSKATTWYDRTQDLFPPSVIVKVPGDTYVQFLENGACNVIAGESANLLLENIQKKGFTGSQYEVGKNLFSKEPLTAVTKESDPVWSKFVSWVFQALIFAEEMGVTKSTATAKLTTTQIFGTEFQNMFLNAVAAVGNYGELYETHLQAHIPRGGLNELNVGDTGLLYSFPFGGSDVKSGVNSGGTIQRILSIGNINCGISTNTPGFATQDPVTSQFYGFEIDLCEGIAAALFNGAKNANFRPVIPSSRFKILQEGKIDILLSGVTHNFERDIKEPSTGKMFDFTPSYFYDGLRFAGRLPYAMCADGLLFDEVTLNPECQRTKICVPKLTTWHETIKNMLEIPKENIFPVGSVELMYDNFIAGECNVIAGETITVALSTVAARGFPEDETYFVGKQTYSREEIAISSRSDDAQFSDFLRWIVHGLIYAAEKGITKDKYYQMPVNLLFGDDLSGMWQNLVKAVGNYDEMFQRNLESVLDRDKRNMLNDNNGPQLHATVGLSSLLIN